MSERSLPVSSIDVRVDKDDRRQYGSFEFPQYPTDMVAEPNPSQRSDEDIARIVSLVVQGLLPQINRQHGGRVENVDGVKKGKLDEKYFRRMDKFT
eukprot:2960931-Karenia_brevis.AAC.1